MDISKMNRKVMVTGPGQMVHEHALIKGNTVYMISAQDIDEAMAKLKKQARCTKQLESINRKSSSYSR